MNKKAFSMIELVFVIVVLGILAGVALPRLAASRDDAEYSKAIQNINILVRDLSDFYMSQGIPGIPILKEHVGNEGATSWRPANVKLISNVPIEGPMAKGWYNFNVGGKVCFTLRLDVVDIRATYGDYIANQIDRDILLLEFHKDKTNTKRSCVMVQESQIFNRYNDDPKDGGKIRLFNQKITKENGAQWYFKVTGGLIAGQDKGLFDDEVSEYSEEELKKILGSGFGSDTTSTF